MLTASRFLVLHFRTLLILLPFLNNMLFLGRSNHYVQNQDLCNTLNSEVGWEIKHLNQSTWYCLRSKGQLRTVKHSRRWRVFVSLWLNLDWQADAGGLALLSPSHCFPWPLVLYKWICECHQSTFFRFPPWVCMWRMDDVQLPRNKHLFQWKVIIVLFSEEIAEILK